MVIELVRGVGVVDEVWFDGVSFVTVIVNAEMMLGPWGL